MALEIEAELTEEGAVVVGPAGSLEAAMRLIEAEPIDAALLDANLAGKPVDALAAALAARGVPFAFASGYGPSGLPEGFRDRPLLGKPFGVRGAGRAGPRPAGAGRGRDGGSVAEAGLRGRSARGTLAGWMPVSC